MPNSPEFKLSVISPVYRAEGIVDELVARLKEVLESLPYNLEWEIILVEDGGPDNSWQKIEQNAEKDDRVKGIKLSRNFGQHCAIEAGVSQAAGDFQVVMDCDLQENPKYIKDLLEQALSGYDVVLTRKKHRNYSFMRTLQGSLFRKALNVLLPKQSYMNYDPDNGTMTLFSKKVADAYLSVNDWHKPFLLFIPWTGFSRTEIEIDHEDRFSGSSSYNFFQRLVLAEKGLLSFSAKPLYLIFGFGGIISLLSFLGLLYVIISYIFFQKTAPGWASIIITILFSTGVIITVIGGCSLYIANIFQQVKDRPRFIIDKIV